MNSNLKVQVLVAAMQQHDHSLLKKMNINTDVIVGNQCSYNKIEKFEYNEHTAMYLNFAETGVGLNRNNSLMRATGDICLFADDDMIYVDGYEEIVQKAFQENEKADVLIFNLIEEKPTRYIIQKKSKVTKWNYLRYGTARIAVRLKSIKDNGIYFNQCFGGGTEHSHGEDNLFLTECLNKKLKIYAIPVEVAILTEERESTWEQGYNRKYFKDQGALYKTISHRWWKVLCFQDAVRHAKLYRKKAVDCYREMIRN